MLGQTCRAFQALLLLLASQSSFVTRLSAEPLAKGIQDNSFFIEEAYNQEPGIVQHIINLPAFFTHGEEEITPSFTQEWPIFSQTQFSYTIPYSFTEGDNGFEDIRLNYRLQALMEGERTPAFAPRFSLVTPAGDASKGFGHDRLGYEINLPFSKIVSDRVTLNFNAGGSLFPDISARPPEPDRRRRLPHEESIARSQHFFLPVRVTPSIARTICKS